MTRLTLFGIFLLLIGCFACEKETFTPEGPSETSVGSNALSTANEWFFSKKVSNDYVTARSVAQTDDGQSWQALGTQKISSAGINRDSLPPWVISLPIPQADLGAAPFEAIILSPQMVELPDGTHRSGEAIAFYFSAEDIPLSIAEAGGLGKIAEAGGLGKVTENGLTGNFFYWQKPILVNSGRSVAEPLVYTTFTETGDPESIVVHTTSRLGNHEVQDLFEVYDLVPPKSLQNLFDPAVQLRIRKNADTGMISVILDGLSE
jgi:hypothetical protein